MYKKWLLSGIMLFITGCSITNPQEPFPGEFIGADYIISDQDAHRWAIASRQAELCIYPNLTRIQQQHFSKEDAYIHAQYVLFYPLEEFIGSDYVKMIQEDEKSMGYAQRQFKKFKTDKVKALPNEQCQILRNNARNDLDVLKGKYKNGMVDITQDNSETKNSEGLATSENKFFFDIIKWGAMLLL
ncbi:DUF5358 domain-containing protein [Nicoletella semolina]|nr:DUF5358 domain-containing protein [Nicoletella semolina]